MLCCDAHPRISHIAMLRLSAAISSATQAFGAYWTAIWSLLFYLSLEKVWNFQLLSTPWYLGQPLFIRLVTMQVGASGVSWRAGGDCLVLMGLSKCFSRT